MNDKTITKICFFIILINLILFVIFYSDEFNEKNLSEMLENINSKGKVFGRVEKLISNNNNTIFIFSQDTTSKVFYPKEIELQKGDFVWVYGTSEKYKNEIEIVAHKVIKE